MKVEIVNDDDLDISKVEVFHYSDAYKQKELLHELFAIYHNKYKRYTNNYTPESLNALLAENRFSYGFLLCRLKGEPFSFFGISEFNNWLAVTRWIAFKKFKLPLSSAFMIPKLEEIARINNKNGVVFTFNEGNKKLHDAVVLNKLKTWIKHDHLKNKVDHEIYRLAHKHLKDYVNLDYPVLYKYTKQYVSYKSFDGKSIPNFEKYYEK